MIAREEHAGVNDLYREVPARVGVVLVQDDPTVTPRQESPGECRHTPGECDEVVGDVAQERLHQ